jgi:hypothetical protein
MSDTDFPSFETSFQVGQALREQLGEIRSPVLQMIAAGVLKGLSKGSAEAAAMLREQLQHDLEVAQLEREHRSKVRAMERAQEVRAQERELEFP